MASDPENIAGPASDPGPSANDAVMQDAPSTPSAEQNAPVTPVQLPVRPTVSPAPSNAARQPMAAFTRPASLLRKTDRRPHADSLLPSDAATIHGTARNAVLDQKMPDSNRSIAHMGKWLDCTNDVVKDFVSSEFVRDMVRVLIENEGRGGKWNDPAHRHGRFDQTIAPLIQQDSDLGTRMYATPSASEKERFSHDDYIAWVVVQIRLFAFDKSSGPFHLKITDSSLRLERSWRLLQCAKHFWSSKLTAVSIATQRSSGEPRPAASKRLNPRAHPPVASAPRDGPAPPQPSHGSRIRSRTQANPPSTANVSDILNASGTDHVAAMLGVDTPELESEESLDAEALRLANEEIDRNAPVLGSDRHLATNASNLRGKHSVPAVKPGDLNPRRTWWFRDGRVVGGAHLEHVSGEFDWECNGAADPSFNPVEKPAASGHASSSTVGESATVGAPPPTVASAAAPDRSAATSRFANAPRLTGDKLKAEAEKRKVQYEVLHELSAFHDKELWDKFESRNDGDFTGVVLSESRFDSASTLPTESADAKFTTMDEKMFDTPDMTKSFTDQQDTAFREYEAKVQLLLDNPDYQPQEYRRSCEYLGVERRTDPRLPGQKGKHLLWPQVTGARHIRERQEELYAQPKGSREQGVLLADQTGLGKTNTMLASRLDYVNKRKKRIQSAKDRGDDAALEAIETPKPMFVVTAPHLVRQTAKVAAEFSDVFEVVQYGGSSHSKKMLPPRGVSYQQAAFTRAHAFFDHRNEMNAHLVIVMSYHTLAVRHGPGAQSAFFEKSNKQRPGRFTQEWIKEYAKKLDVQNFVGNIRDLAGWLVMDEAQFAKNFYAMWSYAARWSHPDFVVLMTATPIPWRPTCFGGLLSFMQDPSLNFSAQQYFSRDDACDAYAADSPAEAIKYRYTYAAFSHSVDRDTDAVDAANALRAVWSRFMVRRDFTSKCEVGYHEPKAHCIGEAMPHSEVFRLVVQDNESAQAMYDVFSARLTERLYRHSSENPDLVQVNGQVLRQLNLMSVSPLLSYARGIHSVTIADKDDSKKRVRNPVLTTYDDLFLENDRKRDIQFIRKLLRDIKRNADEDGQGHIVDLPPKGSEGEVDGLLENLCMFSVRLRSLYALVSEMVVARSEKMIIFCQHPFEQQFVTVCLRVLGIKAAALLSTMNSDDKDSIIARFDRPLSHWSADVSDADRDADIEVLVLSYAMNSGLNLQTYCHNMIAFSPAPSWSIWIQSMGRIVRFGQPRDCTIVEIFVKDTFNVMQLQSSTRNALAGLAALMSQETLSAQYGYGEEAQVLDVKSLAGFVLYNDTLWHQGDISCPEAAKALQPIAPQEVLLHFFHQLGHRNVELTGGKGEEMTSTPSRPLFETMKDAGIRQTPASTPARHSNAVSAQELAGMRSRMKAQPISQHPVFDMATSKQAQLMEEARNAAGSSGGEATTKGKKRKVGATGEAGSSTPPSSSDSELEYPRADLSRSSSASPTPAQGRDVTGKKKMAARGGLGGGLSGALIVDSDEEADEFDIDGQPGLSDTKADTASSRPVHDVLEEMEVEVEDEDEEEEEEVEEKEEEEEEEMDEGGDAGGGDAEQGGNDEVWDEGVDEAAGDVEEDEEHPRKKRKGSKRQARSKPKRKTAKSRDGTGRFVKGGKGSK